LAVQVPTSRCLPTLRHDADANSSGEAAASRVVGRLFLQVGREHALVVSNLVWGFFQVCF
jgi:hypothetical protein